MNWKCFYCYCYESIILILALTRVRGALLQAERGYQLAGDPPQNTAHWGRRWVQRKGKCDIQHHQGGQNHQGKGARGGSMTKSHIKSHKNCHSNSQRAERDASSPSFKSMKEFGNGEIKKSRTTRIEEEGLDEMAEKREGLRSETLLKSKKRIYFDNLVSINSWFLHYHSFCLSLLSLYVPCSWLIAR